MKRKCPMRMDVLTFVEAAGKNGVTDDEIEDGLKLPHQSASARRRELVKEGLVVHSGKKRKTKRDKSATIWVRSDSVTSENVDFAEKVSAKRRWSRIRDELTGFFYDRAEPMGVPKDTLDMVVTQICHEFMENVAMLQRSTVAKFLHRLKSFEVRISRLQVLDACNELGMPHPAPGQLPNIKEATSRKRQLVRQVHPDRSGTEETAERYQQILEAHNVIEQYLAQQQGKGRKREKSSNGVGYAGSTGEDLQ